MINYILFVVLTLVVFFTLMLIFDLFWGWRAEHRKKYKAFCRRVDRL